MMWRPDALQGRVALVTGASRGIGRAVAAALAGSGATVWLAGRDEAALAAACRALDPEQDGRARALLFDVADPQAVKAAFTTIQKGSGRLDILVNNAGLLREATIEMTAPGMIDELLAVNLRGLMLCSQYGVRLMARSGGGSIINMSSIMGRHGRAGQVAYSATKAGVIGATLSLAKETAARNVRVNAVAPGMIDTEMLSGVDPATREELIGAIGLGRIGTAEDVAPLCVFLASDGARYITGQVIGVDGGMQA